MEPTPIESKEEGTDPRQATLVFTMIMPTTQMGTFDTSSPLNNLSLKIVVAFDSQKVEFTIAGPDKAL